MMLGTFAARQVTVTGAEKRFHTHPANLRNAPGGGKYRSILTQGKGGFDFKNYPYKRVLTTNVAHFFNNCHFANRMKQKSERRNLTRNYEGRSHRY